MTVAARRRRNPWYIGVIIAVGAIAAAAIALTSVVPFRSETARAKVAAVLADRLDSRVELQSLQLRLFPRFRAEGAGLVVMRGEGVPPLITIKRFHVEGDIFGLLRKHIARLSVDGLDIQIPPDRDSDSKPAAHDFERTFVIDELVTTDARLAILSSKPHKRPKVWAIHALRLQSVSFDGAMPFEATLTNAIPPGEIVTDGTFGPWQRDDPGRTPLGGRFTFDKADLGVFDGITGILAARGTFGGTLERIDIHGETKTPEFTIAFAKHPVPLTARYHTIVDGTNGDTILERIDASFLNTSLVATGAVLDMPGDPGRAITLEVTMDKGRIEDVMKLAVPGPTSPMVGALSLATKFVLPPGKQDVVRKLLLDGDFSLGPARFTDPDVQKKINELSSRSRGQVAVAAPQRVDSDFHGSFKLANGRLSISPVTFDVPGSVVRLTGVYDLVHETLNFTGTLFMDAKISQTTTGFKRTLLKIVDPLFSSERGGSAIPIKITGSRNEPSFGLDKGRVFKRK